MIQCFRITIIAGIISVFYFNAQADDPANTTAVPLSMANKNTPGIALPSALPRFFPLRGRPLGKIAARAYAAPRNEEAEEIPVAHEGTPEKMTREQAMQILSLFDAGE